jgi:GAF domain-containing protein
VGPEPSAQHGRLAGLIADTGELLARSLDYGETLAAIARLLVPAHADWCFVELVNPSGGIDRVVIEHADPSKRAFVEEYDRRYPLDPDASLGSAQVIRTGEPELMEEIPDGFWDAIAQDPEQHRLLREAGFASALIVPLRVRGAVIGDIALATAESGRRYGADDVRPLQELADRCALAIDNARLYTAQLEARDDLRAILEGVADAIPAQAPDGWCSPTTPPCACWGSRARTSCCPPRPPRSGRGSRRATTTATRCPSNACPARGRWPGSGRRR